MPMNHNFYGLYTHMSDFLSEWYMLIRLEKVIALNCLRGTDRNLVTLMET